MTSLPDDQVLQLRAIKSERCAASDRNTCARSSESASADHQRAEGGPDGRDDRRFGPAEWGVERDDS
ncbi:hypothetical protein LH20_19140 [Sphingopyxis sp. 113P3]|nr:hypothetical protein LH20_19140 [Sphingopyxis sp. 113P3]